MDAMAVSAFPGLVHDETMSEAEALFCWVDAVKIASAWLTKFQSEFGLDRSAIDPYAVTHAVRS